MRRAEPERIGRRPALRQQADPLEPLRDRRDVTALEPPERIIRPVVPLEPALSVAHDPDVRALVDVRVQALERLPYGHVHENGGVLEWTDVRRVPRRRLEPPHEAGRMIAQRIDRLELGDEL